MEQVDTADASADAAYPTPVLKARKHQYTFIVVVRFRLPQHPTDAISIPQAVRLLVLYP
jgi:hypothetical protein